MFLAISDSVAVVITIITILGLAGLSVLLWFSIAKESKKVKEEKKLKLEGVLGVSEFNSFVSSYITKVNATFTLLYIDIDSFAEVGDAFGEDESYHTLEVVAKRIRAVLPANSKIGRVDSESFVVFLNKDFERLQILSLTQRIKDAVGEPITIFEDAEIQLTLSIGISFYPIHGETVKDLLRSLKLVIYTIKKNGGNAIKIYSGELETDELSNRMEYYYQIRSAIEQKQFQLYYQPMIDVENKKVFAIESLLRWNHPEHGILAPNRFINVMEQSGDIYWVGLWGLETVVAAYFDFVKIDREIKVSINLSPKQLVNNLIAKDFQKIIKKYHIDPRNIILEISEFSLFDKQLEVVDNLIALKEMGFEIAVDGFGIDLGSLHKLESLKLDVIKLDKSYLTEEETSNQVRFMEALIAVAEESKIKVVSEGIGSKELYDKALAYKVNIIQGYHFSVPRDKIDMENYLSRKEYLNVIDNISIKIDEGKKEITPKAVEEVVSNVEKEPLDNNQKPSSKTIDKTDEKIEEKNEEVLEKNEKIAENMKEE